MDPQDVVNVSQWLQQLVRDLADTHTQLEDMRKESKMATDEVRSISNRIDQRDSNILSLIEALRAQVDITKNSIGSLQSHIDGRIGNLESQIKELKSEIQTIHRRVS